MLFNCFYGAIFRAVVEVRRVDVASIRGVLHGRTIHLLICPMPEIPVLYLHDSPFL